MFFVFIFVDKKFYLRYFLIVQNNNKEINEQRDYQNFTSLPVHF